MKNLLPFVLLAACGPQEEPLHTAETGIDSTPQPLDTGYPVDFDRDGYPQRVDCDDNNPLVHPDMDEDCTDIDRDCDGDPTNGQYFRLQGLRTAPGDESPSTQVDAWHDTEMRLLRQIGWADLGLTEQTRSEYAYAISGADHRITTTVTIDGTAETTVSRYFHSATGTLEQVLNDHNGDQEDDDWWDYELDANDRPLTGTFYEGSYDNPVITITYTYPSENKVRELWTWSESSHQVLHDKEINGSGQVISLRTDSGNDGTWETATLNAYNTEGQLTQSIVDVGIDATIETTIMHAYDDDGVLLQSTTTTDGATTTVDYVLSCEVVEDMHDVVMSSPL